MTPKKKQKRSKTDLGSQPSGAAGASPGKPPAGYAPNTGGSRDGVTIAPWLTHSQAEMATSAGEGVGPASIPQGLSKYRGQNVSGTLMFPDREQFGRVHLFGAGLIRFGREKPPNDVKLCLFPPDMGNVAKTGAISAQHFEMAFEGESLVLKDKSRFGTSLNGKKLAGSALIPLDQVSEVEVAVSLKLRLTPFVKHSTEVSQVPYLPLGDADALWTTAARLGVGGVIVERVVNAETEECYLMVLTWVPLGPAFDGDSGMSPVRGGRLRIVRWNEQLWLHNVASVAPVEVNGIPVPAGSICPLLPAMRLTLGDELAEYGLIRQYGFEARDGGKN